MDEMKTINDIDLVDQTAVEIPPAYDGEVADLVRNLLLALGENPDREGLQRTPERVERMFNEILSGYRTELEVLVNNAIFESDYQEPVTVRDIEFYSLCEHHLLPFFGKVHVAYIPNGKIIGLSKIPRLVDMFSRRLQVQERMTQQIAEMLEAILQPRGVAVWVEGSHMCAMMRGVKKKEATLVTQAMLGAFKDDKELRSEFLAQVRSGRD
jgi:GTP cyclohydrolase I